MTTDNSGAQRPVLGLIVPPAAGLVPPEGPEMYPEIDFIAQGLALSSVDKEGYDQVIDQVVDAAQKLAARGAQAVSLMGTSLSFYRGSDFNEELVARLRESTGLPCSTMSHAILRGLRVSGIERVAVASSYIDDVNQRLVRFLAQNQIQAVCAYGLGVNDVTAMSQISTQELVDLCLKTWDIAQKQAPGQAQGLLLSCGGLVVSSSPAGFWDLVATAGLDLFPQGMGRLAQTRQTA
jgi:arylmalonate decarboxylase